MRKPHGITKIRTTDGVVHAADLYGFGKFARTSCEDFRPLNAEKGEFEADALLYVDCPACHQKADEHAARMTVTDGVPHWNSNGNIPPEDIVALVMIAGTTPMGLEAEVIEEARAEDLRKLRESMKGWKPSAEEMFEMRAAFGPGETVVNVITGESITL